MSKKLIITIVFLSQTVCAQSPHNIEGTVWATSNYIFRGITNSDNAPAIQTEINYSYEPFGLYGFIWASNIDLADVNTDFEIDYGLGLSGELTNQIGWDIGSVYYQYPGANDDLQFDYIEVYSELNYTLDNLPLTPYLYTVFWYSPDFFGEDGSSAYLEGNIELSLPAGFTLSGHIGYQGVNGDKLSGPEGYDYFDFALGLNKQLYGLDWNISYSNTKNQADACGNTSDCDHQVFISLSKTFK